MGDQRTGIATHVLVSAVASTECGRTGVAVILRDRQRDTIRSTSYSRAGVSVEAATYEVITEALRTARESGSLTMMVYCDVESVVAQLNKEQDVPDPLLAANLQLRAVFNRFRRVQVKLAQSGRYFIAHKLAAGASHGTTEAEPVQPTLSLSTENG
jgi:ribonuclease HI